MAGTQKSRELVKLAFIFGILGAATAASGIILLTIGHPNDTLTESGKWLLQLASVFVGAGVISALLRHIDLARARREAWGHLLQEVTAAHDKAQMAALLLSAHATAKTYSEQISELSNVRVILQRITSSPQLHGDTALRDCIDEIRTDLGDLVREYRDKYLPISRQQGLDEAYLKHRINILAQAGQSQPPQIPDDLTHPLPAWQSLEDGAKFPLLNKFRSDFNDGRLHRNFNRAKSTLESRANIRS